MTILASTLRVAIEKINTSRNSGHISEASQAIEQQFDLLFSCTQTLAVYGSLMPGKENHYLLSDIEGNWEYGSVRGQFYDDGWAAGLGYPAMRWDPAGEKIPVAVLHAEGLPQHWERLDAFEGSDYRRILIPVYQQKDVKWIANIYESATKPNL